MKFVRAATMPIALGCPASTRILTLPNLDAIFQESSLAYAKIQGLESLKVHFEKGRVKSDEIPSLSKNSITGKKPIVIPLMHKKIFENIYPWSSYSIYSDKIIIYDLL